MFHNVKGYTRTKDLLLQMVAQDRVPHALLFSSPAGSAALPLAHGFMTYLHCTQRMSGDACGQCRSCYQAKKLVHPDMHYLFPMPNGIPQRKKEEKIAYHFAQWRTFVQQKPYGDLQDWQAHVGKDASQGTITKAQIHYIRQIISKKSSTGGCKTILVWLPEQLHLAAANAMLKMIEEPEPNTYFVLVSFDIHRIIPTLQSRLWPIRIAPCDDESLQQLLQAHSPTSNPTQIAEIVRMASGNINLALKSIQQETPSYFDSFTQWMRHLYKRQFGAMIEVAEIFHSYPAQVQQNWISYALQMLRSILLHPFSNVGHQASQQEITFCQNVGKAIKPSAITSIIEQLNHLHLLLQRHANAKLSFIHASTVIARAFAA